MSSDSDTESQREGMPHALLRATSSLRLSPSSFIAAAAAVATPLASVSPKPVRMPTDADAATLITTVALQAARARVAREVKRELSAELALPVASSLSEEDVERMVTHTHTRQ